MPVPATSPGLSLDGAFYIRDPRGNLDTKALLYTFAPSTTTPAGYAGISKAVATLTAVTLWDSALATAQALSMDFLFLLSNGNLDLEFVAQNGDVNERAMSIPLAANLPLFLGLKRMYYNYAPADVFAGTVGECKLIRAYNPGLETVFVEGQVWKA